MYKTILTILLSISSLSYVHAYEAGNAFRAVDKFFLAISQVNHDDMKSHVSDSFVLLEHGQVWSIEDLVNVVTPTDYARDNYFSIINMKDYGDIVTVNYWNKANFHNPNYNQNVIWLESVIIEKINGVWRLSQMHSTRLPPGEEPKEVVFTKQET